MQRHGRYSAASPARPDRSLFLPARWRYGASATLTLIDSPRKEERSTPPRAAGCRPAPPRPKSGGLASRAAGHCAPAMCYAPCPIGKWNEWRPKRGGAGRGREGGVSGGKEGGSAQASAQAAPWDRLDRESQRTFVDPATRPRAGCGQAGGLGRVLAPRPAGGGRARQSRAECVSWAGQPHRALRPPRGLVGAA